MYRQPRPIGPLARRMAAGSPEPDGVRACRRRTVYAAALLAAAGAGIGALPAAYAQDGPFPARALRLLVGATPGGGQDFVARTLGQRLSEGLGQPVLVDNRAGAGGLLATEMVARAQPDGYTLLLGFSAPLSISPALQKVDFDPQRDFVNLDLLASSFHILVTHPSVPSRSVPELIAFAKAHPGKLNYASGGPGSNLHLAGELFRAVTGTELIHIPYKGSGPAAAAVLAGEAQLMFSSITAALPLVRAGKLHALAVTSPKRSPLAPELPTLAELGVAGTEAPSWYTLKAPAKTARAAVERLRAEVHRVVAIPEFRDALARQAIDVQTLSQAEFSAFLKAELARYAKIVKAAKIRPD
jgi:tripartite-type tricarboxylate transporter receptor subunit TctC